MEDRKHRTISARAFTACGPPWPTGGRSTRSTPTRAARRSPRAMLGLTRPQPGERVLELACGPAGLGLAAAERVGPTGGRSSCPTWSPR